MRGPKVCESSSSLVITPPGTDSVTVRRSLREVDVRATDDGAERQAGEADARRVDADRAGRRPACPGDRQGPGSTSSADQVGLGLAQVVAPGERARQVDEVRARRHRSCRREAARPCVLLTRSTSNVRSVAPRHCGCAGAAVAVEPVSGSSRRRVMPCSGRSIAATMKHWLGEGVRHGERLRTVAGDAVLHDHHRPAAGGLARAGRRGVRDRDQRAAR